jgi:hypothetical protein
MLRSTIVAAGFVALAFAIVPAEAGKKGPLPCGDYDGVPFAQRLRPGQQG